MALGERNVGRNVTFGVFEGVEWLSTMRVTEQPLGS